MTGTIENMKKNTIINLQLIKDLINQDLEKGMTQIEISNKIGLDQSTIQKYLYTSTKPEVESLIKISNAYCLPLEAFINEEGKTSSAARSAILNAAEPEPPYTPDESPDRRKFVRRHFDKLHYIHEKKVPDWMNFLEKIHVIFESDDNDKKDFVIHTINTLAEQITGKKPEIARSKEKK